MKSMLAGFSFQTLQGRMCLPAHGRFVPSNIPLHSSEVEVVNSDRMPAKASLIPSSSD